ncbi:hypothetical protein BDL97_02G010400 [Sphagnum fallax]|nr:hypothetical protein BDL97_02G010400 [Sphagnum fallax]
MSPLQRFDDTNTMEIWSVSKLGSEYIPEVLVVTPWVFDATNEGVRSSGSSYAEPSKKMFGVLFECFRKLLAKFLADDSLPILHSTCHHQECMEVHQM